MAKAARAVKSESILTTDWLRNHVLKVLFFLSLLLYANTIPNEYCLDDELVTQNHRLTAKGISAIPEIIEEPYYKDEMGYSYGYRPVTLIFFAITHELWGENPHAEHLVNALLYACLVVVFFVFLRIVFPNLEFWPLFFATVFFTVYPPHTEVVASLKNRDELLSFLGGLAAGVFLFNDKLHPLKAAVFAIVAFALGVYSKNSIVLFPAFLGLLSFIQGKPSDYRTLIFGLPAIWLAARQLEGIKGLEWYLFIVVSFFCISVSRINEFSNWIIRIFLEMNSVRNESLQENGIPLSSTVLSNRYRKTILYVFPFYLIFCYIAPLPASLLMILLGSVLFFLFINSESAEWLAPQVFLAWGLASSQFDFSEDCRVFVVVCFLMIMAWMFRKPLNTRTVISAVCLLIILGVTDIVTSVPEFLVFGFMGSLFWFSLHRPLWRISWILSGLLCLQWLLEWQTPIVLTAGQRIWFYSGGLMKMIVFLTSRRKILPAHTMRIFVLIIPIAIGIDFFNTNMQESARSIKIRGITELRSDVDKLPEAPTISDVNRSLNYIEAPIGFKVSSDTLFASTAHVTASYLMKLFLPWPMVCYYGYKVFYPIGLTDAEFKSSIVILLFLPALLIYAIYTKNRLIISSIVWLIFALLPYSNLIGRIPGVIADRYLLIPSAAFALMLAGLFSQFLKPGQRQASMWMLVLLVYSIPASALTLLRNKDWKDHLCLLKADIQTVPESVQLNNLLASHLIIQASKLPDGEQQALIRREAETYFSKSVNLYPYFFNTWYDLGRTRFLLGDWRAALAAFIKAEELKSDFPELKVYKAKCMSKIGFEFEQQGDYTQAMLWYEKAIGIDSLCEMAYNSKSFLYFKQQQPQAAAVCLKSGIQYLPESFDLHANLGKVYMQLQSRDSALVWFRRALKIRPGDSDLQRVVGLLESNPQP